jgi:hypothetical protein
MAFKLSQSDSFWYPVVLHDTDDNGRYTAHQIKAQFKRLPTDDIERFQTSGFDPVLYAECVEKAHGDRDMAFIILSAELANRGQGRRSSEERADELMEILCGWKDVTDDEGDLPFTRDNLVLLLRFSRSAYADIKEAYNSAINGEGKRKN